MKHLHFCVSQWTRFCEKIGNFFDAWNHTGNTFRTKKPYRWSRTRNFYYIENFAIQIGCPHSTEVALLRCTQRLRVWYMAFAKIYLKNAEIYQQCWLEESRQRLENVHQTHLVLSTQDRGRSCGRASASDGMTLGLSPAVSWPFPFPFAQLPKNHWTIICHIDMICLRMLGFLPNLTVSVSLGWTWSFYFKLVFDCLIEFRFVWTWLMAIKAKLLKSDTYMWALVPDLARCFLNCYQQISIDKHDLSYMWDKCSNHYWCQPPAASQLKIMSI